MLDSHATWEEYRSELALSLGFVTEKMIDSLTDLVFKVSQEGGFIYIVGNGGSASIAQHAICDFTKGASGKNGKIKSVDLTSVATITAYANDSNYSEIYASQINTICSSKDLLILVSSSGNSPNIISAAKTAKKLDIQTFALVGFEAPSVCEYVNDYIWVKSTNYGIVEDVHMSILHSVSQKLRLLLR